MRPEDFLADDTPPPIDEEEIREALATALRKRAPPALIRLVGRQAYTRCSPRIVGQLCSGLFRLLWHSPPARIRLAGRQAYARWDRALACSRNQR